MSSSTTSLWVRASERQPPVGARAPWRDSRDHSTCGFSVRDTESVDWGGGLEWLDLDAVDRLAAENDRLREELVNEREISGARIAKLEAEVNDLRSRIPIGVPGSRWTPENFQFVEDARARIAELEAERDAREPNRAANTVRGRCRDCRFLDGKADMGRNCHRHPQARPIAFPELHWCGEFDPKEATLS